MVCRWNHGEWLTSPAIRASAPFRTAQHLRSEAEHKDLVGQIGQLNLYRESNAMLRYVVVARLDRRWPHSDILTLKLGHPRSEVEKLQAEVREWKTKYDDMQKQVNPLLAGKRYLYPHLLPTPREFLTYDSTSLNRELVAIIDGLRLEIKSLVEERDRYDNLIWLSRCNHAPHWLFLLIIICEYTGGRRGWRTTRPTSRGSTPRSTERCARD